MEALLELSNISKSFGNTEVLNGVNLTVNQGEFVTLLGSSGCGKTTTLRLIAGLETPDTGSVVLEGQDITGFSPNKRDVNTVFQSYALFPHMNIETNIAYSLKVKGVDKSEIKTRVNEMLDLVQLQGFEKRLPHQLSGGQKQRVAIARSLIARPKVLLLDEPLGALDLQLRRQMQVELKKLQQQLGISFIYITHDQEEAINMSDRIAVMRNGNFDQIGTPNEIYDCPKTAYTASFVGSSNIITGTAKVNGDVVQVQNKSGFVEVLKRDFDIKDGQTATVAIRSEMVELKRESQSGFEAVVSQKSFNGGMLRISVDVGSEEIIASRHGIDSDIAVGEKIFVDFDMQNAVLVEDNR